MLPDFSPRSFRDSVLQTILENDLIIKGQHVLAGVSGGQDSVAMLHVLHNFATTIGFSLTVCHLDHGFRGEESKGDRMFVESLCENLGVECISEYVDVASRIKTSGKNAQIAAREIRHKFYQITRERIGADSVALGHTSDDSSETTLLNIFRGTGLQGLTGIPMRQGNLIRPLIHQSRIATAEYCRAEGIGFRIDSSNNKNKYRRNHLRNVLIPMLHQEYNSSASENIKRLSIMAARDNEYLNSIAKPIFESLAQIQLGEVAFETENLASQPPAISSRLLRNAIQILAGDLNDVPGAVVERILSAIESHSSISFQISASVKVMVTQELTTFRQITSRKTARLPKKELPIPGDIIYGKGAIISEHATLDEFLSSRHVCNRNTVYVDTASLVGNLFVRPRQNGDRMVPLGMTGSKKLQDIMVDAKIPQMQRDDIPVIADEQGIIWVAGMTLADRVKVVPTTNMVTKLSFTSKE